MKEPVGRRIQPRTSPTAHRAGKPGPALPGLRVLTAGCPDGYRPHLEGIVRGALGTLLASGAWTVSLVKIGERWSVHIDGPEPPFKGISFEAPEQRLRAAIAQSVQRAQREYVPPPETWRPAPEKRDRHECPKCACAFEVVYGAEPREAEMAVPVACPYCWHVGQFQVAESAALSEDYRAEPVS
jgi:hypothetical protein